MDTRYRYGQAAFRTRGKMKGLVLTNNPQVISSCPAARQVEGDALKVLLECRRKVHEGYPLLAHPLMGDLRLIHNPFRTVILGEPQNEPDLFSLTWIEESIERIRLSPLGSFKIQEAEDYQTLDFNLFKAAMN